MKNEIPLTINLQFEHTDLKKAMDKLNSCLEAKANFRKVCPPHRKRDCRLIIKSFLINIF